MSKHETQAAPICIGIDPGKNTGYAEWDRHGKQLLACEALLIHQAMAQIKRCHELGLLYLVAFEDARLRTWLGTKGREALQGAGSIKRDCTIWADFLGDLGAPFVNVKPAAGRTKWTAERFATFTGWAGRTNEHGRDAALLVLGRK